MIRFDGGLLGGSVGMEVRRGLWCWCGGGLTVVGARCVKGDASAVGGRVRVCDRSAGIRGRKHDLVQRPT